MKRDLEDLLQVMLDINSDDYKLMKYLQKHGKTHINKILKKFPNERFATNLRLASLSAPGCRKISDACLPHGVENTSIIKQDYKSVEKSDFTTDLTPTGFYSLTELGLQKIRDYQSQRNRLWLLAIVQSLLFPLFIALITTLITLSINGVL